MYGIETKVTELIFHEAYVGALFQGHIPISVAIHFLLEILTGRPVTQESISHIIKAQSMRPTRNARTREFQRSRIL